MRKTKALISIFLLIAVFGGIIFYVWKKQNDTDRQNKENQLSSEQNSDNSPSSLSVQQNSNPLDLGQIPLGGVEGSGGSNNSSTPNTSGIDPSSLKQYEKYSSSKSALFGEIAKGTGKEVMTNKKVTIVYRGWLTNGQLIDESKKDKENKYIPTEFVFGIKEVIPGLQQGMTGMKAGGTRLIIIPPSVGYGSQKHNQIPANSVLVFEVALVKVEN